MLILTDICTGSPDYGFSASGKVAGRYRFARITDIDPLGRLKKNDAKFVDSDGGKILKENDVMIARTGTQVGKAYLYDPKDGELVFASFLIRFHLDPKKVVPAFIKYYMLSNAYKKWAEKTSSGSTRNGLNIETLSKMPVPELTTEKQKEIVRILDSLYHALSIQEDMISLLEQYVQDVFDYKSRELQFKGKLKELFILRTENKQNEEGGTIPIFNSGGISEYARTSTNVKESVIIPRSGTLGNLFYVDIPFAAGTTVFYTEMKKEKTGLFVYHTLKNYDFKKLDSGTVIPGINSDTIYQLPCMIPDNKWLHDFNCIAYPAYNKIASLKKKKEKIIEYISSTLAFYFG